MVPGARRVVLGFRDGGNPKSSIPTYGLIYDGMENGFLD